MHIRAFLEKYRDKHIYYKPNAGNGGDALIAYGAFYLFKQLNIKYSLIDNDTDLTNKIVFYAGGGNLVKEYALAANFISDNLSKFKELVVLPHTISGHTELIQKFDSKITLICREQMSYQYVKQTAPGCNCYLIEDLAFALPMDELKQKLKSNILSIFFRKNIFVTFYRNHILSPIANILFENKLNAFRVDREKTNIERPKNNLDLSALLCYDRNMANEKMIEQNVIDILSVINKYKVVSTNRLHICIGAALLGKEVNLYPNSYYKNESIYLMSLKDNFPNVKWCGERTIKLLELNSVG